MRTNDVRQGRGKVARLPVDVRNVVNQAMRDGKPQAEIVAELAELCSSASFALWRESSRFPSFPKSMKSVVKNHRLTGNQRQNRRHPQAAMSHVGNAEER